MCEGNIYSPHVCTFLKFKFYAYEFCLYARASHMQYPQGPEEGTVPGTRIKTVLNHYVDAEI